MEMDTPLIHLFKTPGGFYLYDVNKNSILNIKKSVYEYLKNSKNDIFNELIDVEIESLKNNGYLSKKRISDNSHPVTDKLNYFLNSKLRMIILQLTQQCNLRCEYCTFSGKYLNRGHANKRMDFDTAKKGIDFLIDNSRDVDSVNIGFYGGEPLLEFDLMKKCIEYATTVAEGKNIRFNFTTNGTLLTKEIIEFLCTYDVNITISLDGPKDVHDKNRKFAYNGCGTFDRIMEKLEMIKKNYPDFFTNILFNIVLDKKGDFNCIDKFFTDYETVKESMLIASEQATNYEKTPVNATEEYNTKIRYEIFKLLLSKVNKLDDKYVSKLITSHYSTVKKISSIERIQTKELPERAHHAGPCIPGTQRLFVDVYGNLYPCEKASESSEIMGIGHIETGFDIERVKNLLNIGNLTAADCVNCWALRFCTICSASIDDTKGLSTEIKRSLCKRVRSTQEESFKDYCTLIEFGHSFEDNNGYYVMEG